MDQLTILAELCELRLLRDLAALSERRREIGALQEQEIALQQSLLTEGGKATRLIERDHAAARTYGAYAHFAQRRLAAIESEKRRVAEAEAACLSEALRAHGRSQAVALLQEKALEHRRASAARRDETNNMAAQISCKTSNLI